MCKKNLNMTFSSLHTHSSQKPDKAWNKKKYKPSNLKSECRLVKEYQKGYIRNEKIRHATLDGVKWWQIDPGQYYYSLALLVLIHAISLPRPLKSHQQKVVHNKK